MTLTARQQQIVEYVTAYHAAHHCSPTIQEMGEHFGISTTAVVNHLEASVRKGALVKILGAGGQARGWRKP